MGRTGDRDPGGVELFFDGESSRTRDQWSHQEASSKSIRVSELEEDEPGIEDSLPPIDAVVSTNDERDMRSPRAAFSATVPAPLTEAVEPNPGASARSSHHEGLDPASTVLSDLRGGLRSVPKVGDIIAERYRVIRTLGEGGMGIVFEVSHARLGKSFALKILRPGPGEDREMRSSFFREAKYASSLNHKNLISVLDYGEDPHCGPYMVMELGSGVLLSHYLHKRGKLQIKRACDLVLQMAEALAYMHQQNIIHCDLKPQNVMLISSEGAARKRYSVKLADFGLAQSRSTSSANMIFGTPQYLSPEVAAREPATILSDVYSLGILFYELLTGRPPFQGSTAALLDAHRYQQAPRITERRGEPVDPALEQLIATALAKAPADRQRSMSAFIYELKNFMHMAGMSSVRSSQGATTGTTAVQTVSPREHLAATAFDAVRLPLATIDAAGTILAANAAFSKFVLGMRIGIEGCKLSESALAAAWTTLERDVAVACAGMSVGRRVEIDLSSGETVRLQMWLEPTNSGGVAVLSLYPEGRAQPGS